MISQCVKIGSYLCVVNLLVQDDWVNVALDLNTKDDVLLWLTRASTIDHTVSVYRWTEGGHPQLVVYKKAGAKLSDTQCQLL